MRIVLFAHSVLSCWNHGNAHFLRGVARALLARGHRVLAVEPASGWSRRNLVADHGTAALDAAAGLVPGLEVAVADHDALDLDRLLDGADLVLVHEWTEPALVARLGRLRAGGHPMRLLFHDTHHRAVTAPDEIGRLPLDGYDGVLAFGAALAEAYRARGWGRDVRVWHEAADTALFRPLDRPKERDLVWIGNWGDGERGEELREFLVGPVRRLGLTAEVHGVRWPDDARAELARAGIGFRGWLANHLVPEAFARARATVHVPRRPYARALPGIPTIRVFEALACGIPLVCAPWDDAEGLFRPGEDYLGAGDGAEAERSLRDLLRDPDRAAAVAASGLATLRARHTCGHRADELLRVARSLGAGRAVEHAEGRWPASTSRSSDRASSPPTGTAPPPTTAG
jgi:spore maturation protein CgeB